MLVSTGKKAKSKKCALRRLLQIIVEVAERTDSERLFQGRGPKSEKPPRALGIPVFRLT